MIILARVFATVALSAMLFSAGPAARAEETPSPSTPSSGTPAGRSATPSPSQPASTTAAPSASTAPAPTPDAISSKPSSPGPARPSGSSDRWPLVTPVSIEPLRPPAVALGETLQTGELLEVLPSEAVEMFMVIPEGRQPGILSYRIDRTPARCTTSGSSDRPRSWRSWT